MIEASTMESIPEADPATYAEMQVVLIDDDPMMLRSLTGALSDLGFAIKSFVHPAEGIDWIGNNGADIVISDIRMPKIDGFEVLKRVKEIDPLCDVIFITAYAQSEHAIRALRHGASDFFHKPFSLSDLHAAIERTTRYRTLAQQRALLSEQVNVLNEQINYEARGETAMLGKSPAMVRVAADIVDVATTSSTVLIIGESGTGKELVATAIHQTSPLKDKPFITVNCASIPEDLFESEMFGHKRGAFTGAVESRTGYVEAADGGTLFLDEIGDMPMKTQPKILRLLEQKVYRRVGETEENRVEVRVIAATNRDLDAMVKEKHFREDLFYRLSVCTLSLPALRERKEDVPLLATYFGLKFCDEMGKSIDKIDDTALAALMAYDYPGNVRELRNVMENTVIHYKHTGTIRREDLPERMLGGNADAPAPSSENWPIDTLNFLDVERMLYSEALNRTEQNVTASARLLGISRGKLRRRLAALDMQPIENE